MYSVKIAKTAQRDLDRIAGDDLERLEKRIKKLGENPRPSGVKKLKHILHRIRVGDWRVLFAIEDADKRVTILRVLRRNEATYRGIGSA